MKDMADDDDDDYDNNDDGNNNYHGNDTLCDWLNGW